ncbi:MAG: BrnA antitoxin family protein [Elusimicrobiota bacterium]
MSGAKEFPFREARRVTSQEVAMARRAIEAKLGVKRRARGRPPKGLDKYKPIQIRLHPKAIQWAKSEAKHRGIGYQTVINQALLMMPGPGART